jgi:hypothetical protein
VPVLSFFSIGSEGIGAVRKYMKREKYKQAVAASTERKTIGSFFNVKDTSAESAAAAATELSFVYRSVVHHHSYDYRLCHKDVEYIIKRFKLE